MTTSSGLTITCLIKTAESIFMSCQTMILPACGAMIHVSLSLNTIESLFDLAKYRFWSGEAIPGVRRPVFIRVRTAYSIAAT